ncbi:aminopeptidase P family protein [Meridianimarinicoccus sp. MJW13]|uniref:aminopeptidase P family protein n=1 Tax=Meridianimarinicoccus sp. MJW13 TaxID=2720031 RepID=UPI0018689096|nr:aminopeptidase P family protein [Fluviibacterium sp. MJW13]
MFQSFETTSNPATGAPRLAALREAIATAGLSGFLVPRADAHQGEYVADCDNRLAWLTGFTGSAGFAAILPDLAGVFVDGRYTVQVRAQVDPAVFTPVAWPATGLSDWLKAHAKPGMSIGFDPWLHTVQEIDTLRRDLRGTQITLVDCENLVDQVWTDRPAAPAAQAWAHPSQLAGKSAADKRADLAADLRKDEQRAAVLTLPDSIAWLLNIRGADIPRIPVVQAFAILHDDGAVDLFTDPAKLAGLEDHLGDAVRIAPQDRFGAALQGLPGPVRIDKSSAPQAVQMYLTDAGTEVALDRDPCVLPKACKNPVEIAGSEAAHLRDGAAMVRFLHWLDDTAGGGTVTEIDAVTRLEALRAETGALKDISFDTIAGAGPNGAIVHYRVTEDSNRALEPGGVFLIDSGGQYEDGTTDITRTVLVPGGPADPDAVAAHTRVLQGVIALSRARFPKGVTGRDLDALARFALWTAGQDYDHGTGHGVGAYLSVHEGPARISRTGNEELRPGMILSNEPGYYREGAFGIRIENLILTHEAPPLPGGDDREMLCFRTLTHVPIDRRLIEVDALSRAERDWVDAYHAETRKRLSPLLDGAAHDWLLRATDPL